MGKLSITIDNSDADVANSTESQRAASPRKTRKSDRLQARKTSKPASPQARKPANPQARANCKPANPRKLQARKPQTTQNPKKQHTQHRGADHAIGSHDQPPATYTVATISPNHRAARNSRCLSPALFCSMLVTARLSAAQSPTDSQRRYE